MQQSHTIRARILGDIVEGRLPFGTRVTIDELAGRYGASHMPVREALRHLAGESLVEFLPSRGARIRSVDRDFVENLFATRIALEGVLARNAARHADAALIETLRRIEEGLETEIANGDFAAALTANRTLHDTINRAGRNPQAVEQIDRHWILIQALWRQVGYGPERLAGVANDHRHLIRALAERDAEAAGMLMGAHVIKARNELLMRMDAESGARA
ncbi:MAG: GntR family transcriptional regulator [Rhodospirillales bacterium]|nr:GntR family transcriptional regulator [Rhodospirillales bacterium]